MHRDIFGVAQRGIRTIFTPTRFGTKEYPGAKPDFVAHNFGDVLDGVRRLTGRYSVRRNLGVRVGPRLGQGTSRR
jgi:hypothetical protein